MPLGDFTKIAIGWTLISVVGLYSFVLSKKSVDKNRYEAMKVRERMRKANTESTRLPENLEVNPSN